MEGKGRQEESPEENPAMPHDRSSVFSWSNH